MFSERFADAACRAALLYLALPVALFIAFWLTVPLAVLVLAVLGYLLRPVLGRRDYVSSGVSVKTTAAKVVFMVLAGIGAVLFAAVSFPALDAIPPHDALKHGTLLSDLSREKWPVVYLADDQTFTVLRYSFAYYLVPAGVAHLVGPKLSNVALTAWTACGVFLFLLMAAARARGLASALFSASIAALFGGIGVLYVLATAGDNPGIWSAVFNAWSRNWGNGWLIGWHPFELRWSAQHALPSWLAAGVLYYGRKSPWFNRSLGLIAICLLLWSPFACLAFVAVVVLAWGINALRSPMQSMAQRLGQQLRRTLILPNFLSAVLGLLLVAFISSDSAAIPVHFFTLGRPIQSFIPQYLLFTALEFGLLMVAVRYAAGRLEPLAVAAMVLLCALPFTFVGAANDLQMRGSQLPMAILMLAALDAMNSKAALPRRGWVAASLALSLVGGVQELLRPPALRLDVGRDAGKFEIPMPFVDWAGGGSVIRPQYVANVDTSSVVAHVFRFDAAASAFREKSIELQDSQLTTFGSSARFDASARRVESDVFADAALVYPAVHLPKGLYRIDALFDWDATSETPTQHAAHLSVHGKWRVFELPSGKATNRRLSTYLQADGEPVVLSFGLGGWSKGKGYVQLKKLTLTRIERSDPGAGL